MPSHGEIARPSRRVVAMGQFVGAVKQVFQSRTKAPSRVQPVIGTQIDQGITRQSDSADVLPRTIGDEFHARGQALAEAAFEQAGEFLLGSPQQLRPTVRVAGILDGDVICQRPRPGVPVLGQFDAVDGGAVHVDRLISTTSGKIDQVVYARRKGVDANAIGRIRRPFCAEFEGARTLRFQIRIAGVVAAVARRIQFVQIGRAKGGTETRGQAQCIGKLPAGCGGTRKRAAELAVVVVAPGQLAVEGATPSTSRAFS